MYSLRLYSAKASVIITNNIKDYLAQYDVAPLHPDIFIARLIDTDPISVLNAFLNQVSNLRNPEKGPLKVLAILRRLSLTNTSSQLEKLL